MPLSSLEHQRVEAAVASANPDQRLRMKGEAEATLLHVSKLMAQRLLSHEENKLAEIAVEMLVRIEAVEDRKGWWFRAKRRLQLTHMYLGGGAPKPFSALIKSEVNDDAVKLKTLTDLVVAKYLPMSGEQLKAALQRDFPPNNYDIGISNNATFVFLDFQEFTFMLDVPETTANNLSVVGSGRYAGFMLCVSPDRHWHCSARDGLAYTATGGAKKLAQLMKEKFGVRDLTAVMAEFLR